MAKKLSEMTPAELAEHNEQKALRARARGYKTRIIGNCREGHLRAVEQQLEYLKKTPTAQPPKGLSYDQMLAAYEAAVVEYKESLVA